MITTCPQCHRTDNLTDTIGHCPTCHETFYGLTAYDAHRTGPHGGGRHCQLQPYEYEANGRTRYGHWADNKNRWHYGKQLTATERERIFVSR